MLVGFSWTNMPLQTLIILSTFPFFPGHWYQKGTMPALRQPPSPVPTLLLSFCTVDPTRRRLNKVRKKPNTRETCKYEKMTCISARALPLLSNRPKRTDGYPQGEQFGKEPASLNWWFNSYYYFCFDENAYHTIRQSDCPPPTFGAT